jgi:hypothetical protein
LFQKAKAKKEVCKIQNRQIRPARAKRALGKVQNGQIRKNLSQPWMWPLQSIGKFALEREIRPPSQAPAASKGMSRALSLRATQTITSKTTRWLTVEAQLQWKKMEIQVGTLWFLMQLSPQTVSCSAKC